MREDAIGLFWQDLPAVKGDRSINRIMPEIPATGWTAPRDFPRLTGAPYISFDTETKDPNLLTHGPGWARGDGHVIGVSIAVPDAAWYFPIRHEVRPEENMNPEHVLAWVKDVLETPHVPKIGANLIYDVGWLSEEGVQVKGPLYDVQFAEPLLNEAGLVGLDHLGHSYLNRGKETSLLYQWSADYYGGKADESQRKNLYRCPPSLVGPYACEDALLPAQILPQQWARLAAEGLAEVFEMECRLIPLLIAMRRAGVSVDIGRAEQVRDQLGHHVVGLKRRLKDMVGFEVNVSANESMQRAFRALGLPMPLDPKKQTPSFAKDLLAAVEHPVATLVQDIKKYEKVRGTFVESYLLNKHVNGKIHCSFHPLRSDDGGTRSGRFSSSDPNLQNMPSRDEELAPLVRSCFVPDAGHQRWRRYDYDQIEYRMLAHYAVGQGSDALREQYNREPKTDYHINAQTLVANFTGLTIPRKPIKNFNFGMTYGMGKAKMVRGTMMEMKNMGGNQKLDGDALYNAYHEAVPFTKETLEHYANQALTVGFVATILGRRSRFDLWEPDTRGNYGEDRLPALPYHIALSKYGKIKRAYSHKSLNRVLQGSAADMMKRAMVILWESGVLDVTGVPRLTVHDELDFSDPLVNPEHEAWRFVQHTMETAIMLRIPVIASLDLGANWGEAT